jgi:hypothetical protein
MKNQLLAKLGFPSVFGLCFEDSTVCLSHVVTTPLGETRPDITIEHPADGETLVEAAARLLDRYSGASVSLATPADRSYIATRPVGGSVANASADVLLRESLRSSSVQVDKMQADTMTLRPGKRELVTIVAGRSSDIQAVAAAAGRWRLVHAEPAPFSLARLARAGDRRRKGMVVRVLLGRTKSLAVLCHDGHPVLWSKSDLGTADEATMLVRQARSLIAMGRASGIDEAPECIVIHGRSDLKRLTDLDWIGEQLEFELHWLDGPGLEPGCVAQGAAMAVAATRAKPINLASRFCRKPKLREIFPWGELLVYAAMLLMMAGMLQLRHNELSSANGVLQAAGAVPLLPGNAIEKQRTALKAKIAAAQQFVDTRVPWTECLRDVTACLPDSVVLTSISGESAVKRSRSKGGGKQGATSLVLKGAVTVSASGLVPHEVDRLLESLRRHPRFARRFPTVELSDLKQFEQSAHGEVAMFTVVCLPKKRTTKA